MCPVWLAQLLGSGLPLFLIWFGSLPVFHWFWLVCVGLGFGFGAALGFV